MLLQFSLYLPPVWLVSVFFTGCFILVREFSRESVGVLEPDDTFFVIFVGLCPLRESVRFTLGFVESNDDDRLLVMGFVFTLEAVVVRLEIFLVVPLRNVESSLCALVLSFCVRLIDERASPFCCCFRIAISTPNYVFIIAIQLCCGTK